MGLTPMSPRTRSTVHLAWLAGLMALAFALRVAHLDYPALFIDEAETAVNAMTILEHGYPTDEYLGLPIFENTLIRPWPGGHPEYEFRDISYSDRGVAVYHGWLPLYAVAASYRLAGIEPDVATNPPQVTTTPHEMRRRTVAARLPSAIFGTLLVLAAYLAARTMAGRDWAPAAGLMAATLACLAPPAVRVAREARYYSATHLFSLLACLMIWLMARRGRWSDFILGGLVFALLFHTHVLTFAVAGIVWLCLSPAYIRRPRALPKLAAFIAIVLCAIVPWIAATGFPGHAAAVPAARELLQFPEDYTLFLVRHWKMAAVLAAGTLWLGAIALLRHRLAERITVPFIEPAGALLLLLGWLVVGYAAFLLLVPAPSAFLWRLTLAVQGPGIVFVALLMAAGARVIGPRAPAFAAVAVGLALLLVPAIRRPLMSPPEWKQPVYGAIDYLRSQDLAPGTRIYASPLNHLTLTLLAGMPVQSSAPVRADFFNTFPHDILILETAWRGQELPEQLVREAAAAAGLSLSDQEARDWTWRLATRRLRTDLALRGAIPDPPLEDVPEFLIPLAAELAARPARREDQDGLWDNPAMFRGYPASDKWAFWQVFFYRFVDPASRSHQSLNYAERIQGARAVVLDSTWVVFHAGPPGSPRPAQAPEALRAPSTPQMATLSDGP